MVTVDEDGAEDDPKRDGPGSDDWLDGSPPPSVRRLFGGGSVGA